MEKTTTEMTRIFVARTLGEEAHWKVGESRTFTFTYRNTNSTWEVTLRKEEDMYAPFSYAVRGRQLTFEGKKPDYIASWGRRYPSMETAFLHIVNHGNDNVNIHDRYKSIDQWLNEPHINNFL